MAVYRLHWPDDQTTQYRNTIVQDSRPSEITAYSMTYCCLNDAQKPIALQFWENENDENPKYSFYEFPAFVETISQS